VCSSDLLSSVRHYDHRRAQEQAFYPCPPPQASDLIEDFDYVQTVVSIGVLGHCQRGAGLLGVPVHGADRAICSSQSCKDGLPCSGLRSGYWDPGRGATAARKWTPGLILGAIAESCEQSHWPVRHAMTSHTNRPINWTNSLPRRFCAVPMAAMA
jgi:hypothetical protein